MQVQSWAAKAAKQPLEKHTFDLPDPSADQVQIKVSHCGLCHSDLSMLNNDWGFSRYPLVAGHEIIGTVQKVGAAVKHLQVGQHVGVGWQSSSCTTCDTCVGGDQNLCATMEGTIIGRPGGFASHVNAQGDFAFAIPEAMPKDTAGPLLCGGATVFNPLLQFDVKPTDRVGIIGVGGLGHLAVQFANKWGCEVTAFTSNPDKKAELVGLGAHTIVSSKDPTAWKKLARHFDLMLVTVNVSLDWDALLATLRPKGRLVIVGAVLEPVAASIFSMMTTQRVISSSPVAGPLVTRQMLEFSARHKIAPTCEPFKMSDINKALAHLKEGKPRYRVVLAADF